MSSIKISQLPQLPSIAANTSNTLFLGVDLPTGVTGKFTATTLAQQLYANNALVVGNNQILFSNTVGQLSGYDPSFLQVNMQNFNGNGSGDIVITGDKGTNSNNYLDLGLSGSDFQTNPTVGTAFLPNDGYLYVQGPGADGVGNLLIGTGSTNTRTVFTSGGLNTSNIVGYIDNSGLHFNNINQQITSNTASALAYTNTRIGLSDSNVSVVRTSTQSAFDQANTANAGVTNLTGSLSITNQKLSDNANSISALTIYTQSAYASINTLSIASNTANLVVYTNAAFTAANVASQRAITSGAYANAAYLEANATALFANNTLFSKSGGTITGNTTVNALLTINGNIVSNSTGKFYGTNAGFNAVYGGLQSGYSVVPYEVAQFSANTGTYAQINFQNINNGGDATTDWIATADNGTDTTNYVDLGIAGSGYDPFSPNNGLGTSLGKNDAYLYAQGSAGNPGGNLVIGTTITGTTLKVIAGGVNANSIVATFSPSGITHTVPVIFADGSSQNTAAASSSYTQQAFDAANLAQVIAGASFVTANGALANTSTITTYNNLTVPGTLTISGPMYAANTIRTPSTIAGNVTSANISFSNSTMLRMTVNADCVLVPTDFVPGKFIDVIITNVNAAGGGANKVIAHGCSALNATLSPAATNFTLTAQTTAHLRYFSYDSDLANTYVTITYK